MSLNSPELARDPSERRSGGGGGTPGPTAVAQADNSVGTAGGGGGIGGSGGLDASIELRRHDAVARPDSAAWPLAAATRPTAEGGVGGAGGAALTGEGREGGEGGEGRGEGGESSERGEGGAGGGLGVEGSLSSSVGLYASSGSAREGRSRWRPSMLRERPDAARERRPDSELDLDKGTTCVDDARQRRPRRPRFIACSRPRIEKPPLSLPPPTPPSPPASGVTRVW